MKLKLDESGHVVVKDGNPVYVHDDGKELPLDAKATLATISRLNGEAKSHRESKETAEEKLKAYKDIDPQAALKALETVGKLSDKKLIDAGEVDKVRGEAKKAFDDQLKEMYEPIVKERDTLKAALVSEKVGGSFARSKLIAEKLTIPSDMVQARFGEAFKLEGDKVVAYDKTGNKLFSRAKPGEVADFDEALEILIDAYPYRDNIMKGTGAHGGGAGGAGNGHAGKSLPRPAFEALDANARMAHIKSGGTVADVS